MAGSPSEESSSAPQTRGHGKTQGKGNPKSMCPFTYVDQQGQLQYKHPAASREYRAVFHHEIRQELLDLASNNGAWKYASPRATGNLSATDQTAYLAAHRDIVHDDRTTWPPTLTKYLPGPQDCIASQKAVWTMNGHIVLDHEGYAMFRRPNVPTVLSSSIEEDIMELCMRSEPDMAWGEAFSRMPPGLTNNEKHSFRMRVQRWREKQGLLSWNENHESWIMKAFLDDRMGAANLGINSIANLTALSGKEEAELKIAIEGSNLCKNRSRAQRDLTEEERNAKEAERQAKEADKKVQLIQKFRRSFKIWPRLLDLHISLLEKLKPESVNPNARGAGMIISTANKDQKHPHFRNRPTNQYENFLKAALESWSFSNEPNFVSTFGIPGFQIKQPHAAPLPRLQVPPRLSDASEGGRSQHGNETSSNSSGRSRGVKRGSMSNVREYDGANKRIKLVVSTQAATEQPQTAPAFQGQPLMYTGQDIQRLVGYHPPSHASENTLEAHGYHQQGFFYPPPGPQQPQSTSQLDFQGHPPFNAQYTQRIDPLSGQPILQPAYPGSHVQALHQPGPHHPLRIIPYDGSNQNKGQKRSNAGLAEPHDGPAAKRSRRGKNASERQSIRQPKGKAKTSRGDRDGAEPPMAVNEDWAIDPQLLVDNRSAALATQGQDTSNATTMDEQIDRLDASGWSQEGVNECLTAPLEGFLRELDDTPVDFGTPSQEYQPQEGESFFGQASYHTPEAEASSRTAARSEEASAAGANVQQPVPAVQDPDPLHSDGSTIADPNLNDELGLLETTDAPIVINEDENAIEADPHSSEGEEDDLPHGALPHDEELEREILTIGNNERGFPHEEDAGHWFDVRRRRNAYWRAVGQFPPLSMDDCTLPSQIRGADDPYYAGQCLEVEANGGGRTGFPGQYGKYYYEHLKRTGQWPQ